MGPGYGLETGPGPGYGLETGPGPVSRITEEFNMKHFKIFFLFIQKVYSLEDKRKDKE